jgi:hypothetical protein
MCTTSKRQLTHLSRLVLNGTHRNIGPRAHDVVLLGQLLDHGRAVHARLVVLDDCAVGRARETVSEDSAVLERWRGRAVQFARRSRVTGLWVVIEEEKEAPAHVVKFRPAVLEDRLLEREVAFADVVGADESAFGEDGEDLGVDVEEAGERPVGCFAGADAAELAGWGVGLELEVDCWRLTIS